MKRHPKVVQKKHNLAANIQPPIKILSNVATVVSKPKIDTVSSDSTNILLLGESNSVLDFCSSVTINGSHNNVYQKTKNINIVGDYNVVEKNVKLATVEGFNHHIKVGTTGTTTRGSYGYNVLSGSEVVSTEFEVDGIKKVGKAQEVKLLMTALVNDRGMSCLKNSQLEKVVCENIYFADRNTIALVLIKYTIISKDGKYMTGIASNTVQILDNGCSEWNRTNFRNVVDENSFQYSIDIVGLNLYNYNNSTSIQIHNSEGNGEIEVLAALEIVALQKRLTQPNKSISYV